MRAGRARKWGRGMAEESLRHFWRPSSDSVRHAFWGRRWSGRTEATSVCGAQLELTAEVSEVDWFAAPTCPACNGILRATQPTPGTPRSD